MPELNKDTVITIAIGLTILVSGCTNNNGGEEEIDEGVIAIEKKNLDVTPNSIYAGDQVEATLTLENNGNSEAKLILSEAEEEIKGTSVMHSYCPDLFKIESFSVTRENQGQTTNPEATYNLQPGEKITLDWTLRQAYEDRVSFYQDSGCEISFTAPFNYSVEGFQQLQIRDNDELARSSLESRSSRGPMLLEVDLIGSSSQYSAPYFNEEDFNPEYGGVTAEIRMINQIPEKGPRGIVDAEKPEIRFIGGPLSEQIEPDEEISAEESDEEESGPRCGVPDTIYLYGGDSTIIGCDLTIYDDEMYNDGELDLLTGRSSISEIRVNADYKYNAPMGSETVKVDFRGER